MHVLLARPVGSAPKLAGAAMVASRGERCVGCQISTWGPSTSEQHCALLLGGGGGSHLPPREPGANRGPATGRPEAPVKPRRSARLHTFTQHRPPPPFVVPFLRRRHCLFIKLLFAVCVANQLPRHILHALFHPVSIVVRTQWGGGGGMGVRVAKDRRDRQNHPIDLMMLKRNVTNYIRVSQMSKQEA